MRSTSESARALARRLIESEESRPGTASSPVTAPLEVSYRLHLVLCRWIGPIGCSTLSTRALRAAEDEHVVLSELTARSNGRPYFDGVEEAIQEHDAATVASGVEAYIEALLGLLGRFVGDDVVVSLAERIADAESGGSEEEADDK